MGARSFSAAYFFQLHQTSGRELPRRESPWRRYVGQLRQQLFIRGKSIFHGSEFRIGQGNILTQPQQVGFGFETLGLRRFLWQIK